MYFEKLHLYVCLIYMYFNIYVSIFSMAQNYDVILSCPRKELQNSFHFFFLPCPIDYDADII